MNKIKELSMHQNTILFDVVKLSHSSPEKRESKNCLLYLY